MKSLLCSLTLLLLALLALSSSALASAEDEGLASPQPPSLEPATDADSQDYTDALLPIRPTNSDDEAAPAATCAAAKSCGRCLSGSFGNCGWCGEHGDEGRCHECVMVEGQCVGSTQECTRGWNARACPSNHHPGRDFVLSVGAIIGITVGGASACALALCACCCWICFRRRRRVYYDELGHHHHHHDHDRHGYVLV